MKITLKRSMMAVLCVVGMSSFVACDEDDPIIPPVIEPTNENGSYAGTMTYTIEELPAPAPHADGDEPVGTPVEYVAAQSAVGIDSIYFAKFPVAELVTAVAGPELAPGIIEALGDVKYTIYYTATSTAGDMNMVLTPKTLVLNLVIGKAAMKVEVAVEAVAGAKYVTETKTMTFSLKATSVKVNGVDFPAFQPITLSFSALKK